MSESKKYNLLEMLTEFTVQIPILQRDFAQGRKNQYYIRNKFLESFDDFFSDENRKKMNLDFVYGYTEHDTIFYPIDGQQRLTTLWLLYIYLTGKLSKSNSLDLGKYDFLANFTYATRESANNFCEKLVGVHFTEKPSQQLKNNVKFKKIIGEADPTVAAMLTMLDAIDDIFCTKDPVFLLTRLNNVTFSVINMKNFQLGEDLYIKMNSRGRQLSSFENFKSWIQKDPAIREDWGLLGRIDNIWINYFWKNSHQSWDSDIIKMMHYLGDFLVLQSNDYSQDEKNIFLKELIGKERDTDSTNNIIEEKAYIFNEHDFLIRGKSIFTYKNILQIDKIILFFDALKTNNDNFTNNFRDEKRLSFLLPKLFAFSFYALAENKPENFADWFAVTNHIVDNTRPKVAIEHVISIFKLLEELSVHSYNIIEYLDTFPMTSSNYANDRVQEEKLKASIIVKEGRNKNWEYAINVAQSHSYFNGWIDFLFSYSAPNNGPFPDIEHYSLEKFINYSRVIRILFAKEFLCKNLKLLQRALLSFGDYSVDDTNRYLGNSSCIDMQHGKEQWHKIFNQKKSIIKELLDKIQTKDCNNAEEMVHILKNIISEKIAITWKKEDWWRKLIISDNVYLDYCKQNRFVRTENDVIYLIPKTKYYKKGINLLAFGFFEYCSKIHQNNFKCSDFRDDFDVPVFSLNNGEINIVTVYKKNSIGVRRHNEDKIKFFYLSEEQGTENFQLNHFYEKIVSYIQNNLLQPLYI